MQNRVTHLCKQLIAATSIKALKMKIFSKYILKLNSYQVTLPLL